MIDMAKRPTQKNEPVDPPPTQFPSRAGYKGTYLPKAIYDELEAYALGEDRSTAFFVKKACLAMLVELRKSGPPKKPATE